MSKSDAPQSMTHTHTLTFIRSKYVYIDISSSMNAVSSFNAVNAVESFRPR
jgi:hypothetical protein